jgi:hypothetical protein
MANKKWSEMSTPTRAAVVVLAVAELIMTTVALRDLSRRAGDSVRGPKLLWRLVCLVQPVGPLAYMVLGRKGSGHSPAELLVGS